MSERALLERLQDGPASGIALAADFGITRSAVWKRIEALREAGVEIEATREGYRLLRPMQLLDRDVILQALPAQARDRLATLNLDFETDSTQARALAAATPERGCAAWLAERQTAGQGRRGRIWVSPLAAHLYLSISRRFERGFAALSGLSLAVGVSVAEALRDEGFPQVRVKWPNDLLVDDRKLAGILIQLRGEMQGPCAAVIGLGVNVAMPEAFAARIDQPWCDLQSLAPGRVLSRNLLAARLLERLPLALEEFEQRGLPPFLERWPALDALAGRRVRIFDAQQEHDGIALGVQDDGGLRLRLAQGERSFHSGEVSVRSAGTRECRERQDAGSDRSAGMHESPERQDAGSDQSV